MSVEIWSDAKSYAPGDVVSGTVTVGDAERARTLTLSLDYRDWTADYEAIARSVPADAPLHEGQLEAGASFPFAIALPADALPNHDGAFGHVGWGLHACVARLGPDIHVWQDIFVRRPVRTD